MKRTILTAVTCALMLSTCANDNQTFAITTFAPLTQCQPPVSSGMTRFYSPSGSLDVAAGDAQFYVGAKVKTVGTTFTGCPPVLFPTGETAVPACTNRPIITEYVVTYTLSKRLGQRTPAPFVVPYRVDLDVSAENDANTVVQLVSSEMSQALYDGLTPEDPNSSENDFVDIDCALEFRGEYSATRAPFTTGTATYTIRAYRSTPSGGACAPDQRYARFRDNTTGLVDTCNYSGQSGAFSRPLPPSAANCCNPATTEGC